ncbi:MAG: lactonase family protein [Gammaproteobacteria bacterium]|nr:lactonase family protein [Gammaproteobacteria bacterium]MBU1492287.1 lactonase family protein [Gammaproteobacteria bacterium]MBU2066292.1 lactonase family protein [Gammaproteobacteria bacterium]MBU2139810.1 lactonase family protein [Gammaproteobacteria bacterium]MBU2218284.1 lactonase family protein [Gammaproteobacteria bacterium]
MHHASRHLLGALLLAPLGLAPAGGQAAASLDLLVGSYGTGIHHLRFATDTGQLSAPRLLAAAPNPSWLILAADGRHLYAVNENGAGDQPPLGQVSAYRLSDQGADLHLLNRVASLGDHPTHARLSADGDFLFVANYAVTPQGSLAVLPVLENGALGPPRQVLANAHTLGPGQDPQRQTSSHVHAAVPSPEGEFVFAADLGQDRLYRYRYDPTQAQQPLQPAEPAWLALPAGSGPRHLVFSQDARFAYLTLELSGQVMQLAYEQGQLRPLQTLDLAPADFQGEQGAGALHLSSDGRFLQVINRGDDNHLSVFAVDSATGRLSLQQRVATGSRQTREFALSPDGRFLLLANQAGNELRVLPRDPRSGQLGEAIQQVELEAPSALLFLPEH